MRHPLLHKAIWRYWESGLSLVPINARTKRPYGRLLPQARNDQGEPLFYQNADDGSLIVTTVDTGSTKGTWEPYQRRQPTPDELSHWIDYGVSSVAVVGGAVSGGVEVLDFDVAGYYEQWADLAGAEGAILPMQRTGGGGIQLIWRCPSPQPNQKLAWHPDETMHSGRRIAIETRGVNGYALLPPSLHPSGNYYELLRGKFSQIPTIDQDHRDFLLTCARSICQAPKTIQEIVAGNRPHSAGPQRQLTGDSVIDTFNEHYTIDAMLQKYNYTALGNGRYSRPGKKDSAGVVVFDSGKSYHMSSNDPLDSDSHGKHQPRSPFDFYAMFEHNGSYKDAVREAAKLLGMNTRKYPQIHKATP
jgi:hypothetical protein